MATHFPMMFTLDSGTKVVVAKRDTNAYSFALTPANGAAESFTYREGEHTKAEWDALLNFEQLDALRAFWQQTEEMI